MSTLKLYGLIFYFQKAYVHTFYEEKGVQPNTFNFKEVTEELVLTKHKDLNPSMATGSDNVPAKFLRDAAEKNHSCHNPSHKCIH